MNRMNPGGVFCRPDPLYYLDHQLKKPIITLLQLVMPDTSLLFENGTSQETIEMFSHSQKDADKEHRMRKKLEKQEKEINDAALQMLQGEGD